MLKNYCHKNRLQKYKTDFLKTRFIDDLISQLLQWHIVPNWFNKLFFKLLGIYLHLQITLLSGKNNCRPYYKMQM
jgi:hypothetical protein